ncbi:MAG: ABC transporter permease subunit [Leptospiraceae bacterium]|nr:ABC transporter permease subunit [Leptospiraceae bacterium]MDW8306621.1 ABC transporter permease subunit [Leptospiraceae bacterium]
MSFKLLLILVLLLLLLLLFLEPPTMDPELAFCPPSQEHPLGCSPIGEDFLRLLLSASGGTLFVAISARILALGISFLTTIHAFFNPQSRALYKVLTQALLTIPSLFLAVLFKSLLGGGELALVSAMGLAEWALSHAWLGGRVNEHEKQTFVEAAYSLGASRYFCARKHLLPHLKRDGLVLFFVYLPSSLLTASALEFLGFTVNSERPGLGYLVYAGKDYIFYQPHLALLPSFMLIVLVFGALYFKDRLTSELS